MKFSNEERNQAISVCVNTISFDPSIGQIKINFLAVLRALVRERNTKPYFSENMASVMEIKVKPHMNLDIWDTRTSPEKWSMFVVDKLIEILS